MEGEILVDASFPLFSRKRKKPTPIAEAPPPIAEAPPPKSVEKELNSSPTPAHITFSDLGLAEWAVNSCKELGMKRPTPVQYHCIPRILAGEDVMGLAETGSGKTAAFALPILQSLSQDPFGVFALVVTPTSELADQLAEQFRALGSGLGLRCAVVVGGEDIIGQAQSLMKRPHVVISTPGRIKALIEQSPDVPAVFSKTKFLVLDEADSVLGVNFEDELKVIFQCLPKSRQTLLFTATMTSNLEALLQVSGNKAYFYKQYEGFKTVESLKQQYIYMPQHEKDVFLLHLLKNLKEMDVRSAIVFADTCRSCELLSLLLEELELENAALHSSKSLSSRRSALHRFKSGRVSVLIATASRAGRGLDIPTVDLVLNYDVPRCPEDYIHRVGRTARAERGGLALSFVTPRDVNLLHQIESAIGKQLEEFECEAKNVVEDNMTKVFKAKRVVTMKMTDEGFDEKEEARRAQKSKTLQQKGLLKEKSRNRNMQQGKPHKKRMKVDVGF